MDQLRGGRTTSTPAPLYNMLSSSYWFWTGIDYSSAQTFHLEAKRWCFKCTGSRAAVMKMRLSKTIHFCIPLIVNLWQKRPPLSICEIKSEGRYTERGGGRERDALYKNIPCSFLTKQNQYELHRLMRCSGWTCAGNKDVKYCLNCALVFNWKCKHAEYCLEDYLITVKPNAIKNLPSKKESLLKE